VLGATCLASLAHSLHRTWPDELAIATVGLALGQTALAAAWVAWGRANLALRAGLLCATVLAWTYPVTECLRGEPKSPWWGGLILLYAALVFLPLVVARLSYDLALDGQLPETIPERKWWQFTIGGVFTLTTLAAMLFGLGRQILFPWEHALPAGLFCAATAAFAAGGVFLAFRAPNLWVAMTSPIVLVTLCGFLLRFTLLPRPPYGALVWMTFALGVTISLSAAVLRVAGFTLIKRTNLKSEI